MYFEQEFDDRKYLCFANWITKHGEPEVIALANKGELQLLKDFDHGRDSEAVQMFKEAYGLERRIG